MTIAACVVWYNPDENCLKNIKSYFYSASPITHLFIIDNSNCDNKNLLDIFPMDNNITYIANKNNNGIAKALNQGCKLAIEAGYQYIMTMDQDSVFLNDNFERYIKEINANQDKAGSFAPNTVQPKETLSFALYWKNKIIKKKKDLIFVDKCISSGNVINLELWKILGGFNEDLFIDQVDFDFCYRLTKQKKILKFQHIYLTHSIGIPKKSLLPEFDSHSGVRIYYIFRNNLYMKKWYPNRFTFKDYKFLVLFYIKNCLNKQNALYIKKALKDYKDGILGEYNAN